MGILISEKTGAVYTLSVRTTIGRSRSCLVRIEDPRVSGEHARIEWSGGRWRLLDLDSRNGTWLRSQRLDPQNGEPIDVSARFHFGAPGDDWRLLAAGPPVPMARALDSGELRVAREGVIRLPDDEGTEVLVYFSSGRWLVETAGETRAVVDLALLKTADRSWQLHLPREEAPETAG